MSRKKMHEEYIAEVAEVSPNFEVIGQYVNAYTKIAHRCKVCNNVIIKEPHAILVNGACPVCSGRIAGQAPDYKNSIWSSEYREYFSDYMTEEQMKTTLPFSNVKINILCPNCGRIKRIAPCQLVGFGLGCMCSDGKSYPNKFMYSLLEQLNVKYTPEYSPDWSEDKIYDDYIPHVNTIVENHGLQHYRDGGFKRKLEDVRRNDLHKERLAKVNGIEHYCVIDCRVSSKDWIKNSIMSSELPELLDFEENDIDWMLCDKFASSNLINSAAELFNKGLNTTQIAKELMIHRKTARRYLKRATDFGLCDYDAKKESDKARKNKSVEIGAYGIFPIYCLEKNAVRYTLKQMSQLCFGADKRNIHACVTQKYKTCGGMHFYYLYDHTLKNGNIIKGAITLGLITEEDALRQLDELDVNTGK